MDKLNVERNKAKVRITRAVRKKMCVDNVHVSYSDWTTSVHAWKDGNIIYTWYIDKPNATVKQICQYIATEG